MPETSDGPHSRTVECHSPCRGVGYYIEQYDAYACPLCGDIAYADNLYETTRKTMLLSGGDEADFIRIVGTVVSADESGGPFALLKSPYEAKEDIKDLPYRESERRWSDEFNHWIILDSWRSKFVEHMREKDWKVIDLVKIREVQGGEDG